MNRSRLLLLALGLAAVAAGCVIGGQTPETTVRQRSSYDLQCAEHNIVIRNIGGTSYAAEGCGARAIYNCTDDGKTCIREDATEPR